jgi:hypothetical protein
MNVQEMIDNELLVKDEERARTRKPSGKFKPSLFGRCYRAQIWERLGGIEKDPIDNRTRRVFKAGQLFHDFVQGLFSGEKEVFMATDDVVGYADLVTENSVIDIKSQHSQAFHYMRKEGEDICRKKYHNWLQVMWYALQLKKEYGKLVFLSKDDLCVMEFEDKAENWRQEVEFELNALQYFWDEKIIPPAEPRAYEKVDKKTGKVSYEECSWCDYKTSCNKMEGKNGAI